jgi:polysaccharide export outer membrane protein
MWKNGIAQDENVRVGTPARLFHQNGAFFDYSDPNQVNIKVTIWGYVKLPGTYLVPYSTTLTDLIAYAGGPNPDALLQDARVVRTFEDSTQQVLSFDYNELMFEEKITKPIKDIQLKPGDMIVLPGEPRFYFRDYVNMTLSIISTLTSLTILVLNIVR